MKYNPVTNTIDRADGTPYLHLAPCIGAQEAFKIADTLLQAPEWEKEREELEVTIESREERIKMLAEELEESEKVAQMLDDAETELTQARLRIEELEAMLASVEAALENTQSQP